MPDSQPRLPSDPEWRANLSPHFITFFCELEGQGPEQPVGGHVAGVAGAIFGEREIAMWLAHDSPVKWHVMVGLGEFCVAGGHTGGARGGCDA